METVKLSTLRTLQPRIMKHREFISAKTKELTEFARQMNMLWWANSRTRTMTRRWSRQARRIPTMTHRISKSRKIKNQASRLYQVPLKSSFTAWKTRGNTQTSLRNSETPRSQRRKPSTTPGRSKCSQLSWIRKTKYSTNREESGGWVHRCPAKAITGQPTWQWEHEIKQWKGT